jgi:hypothetical protein
MVFLRRILCCIIIPVLQMLSCWSETLEDVEKVVVVVKASVVLYEFRVVLEPLNGDEWSTRKIRVICLTFLVNT